MLEQDGLTAEELALKAGHRNRADLIAVREVAPELLRVCKSGDLQGVQELLQNRHELIIKLLNGELMPADYPSPLLAAANGGHVPIVQALLDAGAPLPAEVRHVVYSTICDRSGLVNAAISVVAG